MTTVENKECIVESVALRVTIHLLLFTVAMVGIDYIIKTVSSF